MERRDFIFSSAVGLTGLSAIVNKTLEIEGQAIAIKKEIHQLMADTNSSLTYKSRERAVTIHYTSPKDILDADIPLRQLEQIKELLTDHKKWYIKGNNSAIYV